MVDHNNELVAFIRSHYVLMPNECWIWTGKRRRVYGSFYWRGYTYSAHRAHWEAAIGPIPDGYQVDHICHETLCINLRHLEPVTPRENVKRSFAPSSLHSVATHCIRGHEFTPDNLMPDDEGRRLCWQCYDYKNYKNARRDGKVPFRIRGHTAHQVAENHWGCTCGKWLATAHRKALAAQKLHRIELWAQMREKWGEAA